MKALKITISLLLSSFLFSQAYGASVENIAVVDSKNIDIVFDTGSILPEGEVDSDIKVLKDIAVSFVSRDLESQSKLIVDLNGELQNDSKYSLLSILGPEGNIDFTLSDTIDGLEVLNDVIPEGQGINKVVIKDSKTLELSYNQDIMEEEFEFKLLSESVISTLTAKENTLSVSFESDLNEYSNYILMLLSINDRFGTQLTFDEDLHDFSTEVFVVAEEEVIIDEPEEEPVVEEEPIIEEETDKGTEEIVTASEEDEGNLEEISLNAATTPDTGASTWVLLMLTLITNAGIFFRKKLIKA